VIGHQDHPSFESAEGSKVVVERELNRSCRIVARPKMDGPVAYRVILKEARLPDGFQELQPPTATNSSDGEEWSQLARAGAARTRP
jgi:hypothetical protein